MHSDSDELDQLEKEFRKVSHIFDSDVSNEQKDNVRHAAAEAISNDMNASPNFRNVEVAERIGLLAIEEELANRERQKVVPLSDEALSSRDGSKGSMKRAVLKWRQFAAVFSGAFAAGALVMRFAFMPAAEMARTGGEFIEVDGKSAQRLEIFVDVPSALITEVVKALGKAEMEFALSADQDRFFLLVYDLIPNDPEQQELKRILKINESASGSVLFEVQQRLHD